MSCSNLWPSRRKAAHRECCCKLVLHDDLEVLSSASELDEKLSDDVNDEDLSPNTTSAILLEEALREKK